MPLAKGEIDLWLCFPLRSLHLVHRTCNSWKNDFHGFPDSIFYIDWLLWWNTIQPTKDSVTSPLIHRLPEALPIWFPKCFVKSATMRLVDNSDVSSAVCWFFPNWRVQDKHYVTMLLLLSIQASLVWMNIPAQKIEDGVAAYMTCYCEGKIRRLERSIQVIKSPKAWRSPSCWTCAVRTCMTMSSRSSHGLCSAVLWNHILVYHKNSFYPKGNNREFVEKAKGKRRRDTDLSSPKNLLPTIAIAFPG